MEIKEIQKLLDFIANSGLDEVSIETNDGLKVKVKRNSSSSVVPPAAPAPAIVATVPVSTPPVAPPAQAVKKEGPEVAPAGKPDDANVVIIKSPMIGTFYRASSPESPSFVNIGDEIKPGKVVCVIEAMKLFNEIEAEITGKIVRILVENATPVEFDQPLFEVIPA